MIYDVVYWLCPGCGAKNVLQPHELEAFPGSQRFARVDAQAMEGYCSCGRAFSLVESPHQRKTTTPRSM